MHVASHHLLVLACACMQVDSVVQQLQRFVDEGFLTLEDTIFLLNPRDVALCMPREHGAPAPRCMPVHASAACAPAEACKDCFASLLEGHGHEGGQPRHAC